MRFTHGDDTAAPQGRTTAVYIDYLYEAFHAEWLSKYVFNVVMPSEARA